MGGSSKAAPDGGTGRNGRSTGGNRGESGRGAMPWKLFLTVGAALLLVTGALAIGRVWGGSEQDQAGEAAGESASAAPEQGTASNADTAPMARLEADDPTAMGPVDAPVVMVAYSDYSCPYCGRWVQETQPDLMHYVESGELRIEWRDFPIITDTSETASHAARAAAAQGMFWEFHESYYAIATESEDLGTEQIIDRVVDEIGLDREQFDTDRHSDEVAAQVNRDFSEALSIGATSTPAFLINGQPVLGAQPLPVFEQVIDQALANAQGDTEEEQ
ncbi:DsbA family protein [Nocardiopsis halotolerans]|uniref:DsbA family protein n=1 Tax=Nocardiopsis halotolerans TaxID=124252 RepID=UPI0003474793|nr:DsbA family protein [Nocardiopsis halotolerans]